MNRRSKVVSMVAAALLLFAVVGMASPASAQRYSHRSHGSDWGISLNFGSPYYYDGYEYGGYNDGFGLGYYSYPTYRYRHNRDWDDDYRWRGHDRDHHNRMRNHRW